MSGSSSLANGRYFATAQKFVGIGNIPLTVCSCPPTVDTLDRG
jgi:hypothetical protein